MQTFWNLLYALLGLGLEPKDLTFLQISLRGVIVFAATLVMVRLGDRRSLAQKSAFDLVLITIIASVLARAINGSAAFFATLGGTFVIVLVHRFLAKVLCQWPALSVILKGKPAVLVKEGEFQQAAMRKEAISSQDIEEDMRLEAKIDEPSKIKIARLESSGDISFILTEKSSGGA